MPFGSGEKLETIVKVWNTTNWRLVHTHTGHNYPIFYAEFLNDTTMASCSLDQTIQIWKINGQSSSQYIKTIEINSFYFGTSSLKSTPTSLKLLPNYKLASGDFSGTIYIWNLNSSSLFPLVEKITNAHTAIIYQFELVSDELLASASGDRTIKVWNITMAPMTLLYTLDGTYDVYTRKRNISEIMKFFIKFFIYFDTHRVV